MKRNTDTQDIKAETLVSQLDIKTDFTVQKEGVFSRSYSEDLLDDILNTLPERLHKPAPVYFDKYGKDMEYASFKKNKRTTWYVFFEIYEDNGEIFYLVRYIANNHTVAQYL